jgi:hypothetical protein
LDSVHRCIRCICCSVGFALVLRVDVDCGCRENARAVDIAPLRLEERKGYDTKGAALRCAALHMAERD